jgi:NAD(P)-dependent dehydrogenase (short-subunit alcohol dehydrogenase family)
MSLAGKTIFMSGGSRGIGLAIALRAARDGANIALAAKTAEPHPKLEGTIYTAAEQIEKAGGKALPLVVDIRDESRVAEAVKETAEKFGVIGRRGRRIHRDRALDHVAGYSLFNDATIRDFQLRTPQWTMARIWMPQGHSAPGW